MLTRHNKRPSWSCSNYPEFAGLSFLRLGHVQIYCGGFGRSRAGRQQPACCQHFLRFQSCCTTQQGPLSVSAEGCGGSFRHSLCWPLLLIHQGGLTAACCCKVSGSLHISVGRKHAGSFVTDECRLCRLSYPLVVWSAYIPHLASQTAECIQRTQLDMRLT